MKKIIPFILISLLLHSCKISGLTDDYSKLTEHNKLKIIPLESFENLDVDKIYKISGKQLRSEIAKHEKSLVYIFKNGCTSDLCKPMLVYENYANQNGYTLFLVMEGYGNLENTFEQRNNFTSQLFSINTDLYDSKYRAVYSRMFENELLENDINYKPKIYLGNLFFFEGNQLIKIAHELPKY